jgi:hypothetical protein
MSGSSGPGGKRRSFLDTLEDIRKRLQDTYEADEQARRQAEQEAAEAALRSRHDAAISEAEGLHARIKNDNKTASQQETSLIQQAAGTWSGAFFFAPLMAVIHGARSWSRRRAERAARKGYEELYAVASGRFPKHYPPGAPRFPGTPSAQQIRERTARIKAMLG